jgi:hypothetical protein
MRRVTLAAGGAALTVILGAAAYIGPGSQGPLIAGGDSTEVCMPTPEKGLAALGAVIENSGSRVLTVRGVHLVDPSNLALEDEFIFPLDRPDSYALSGGSTEPDDPEGIEGWKNAQTLQGFELRPGRRANIVVAVDNPGPEDGTAKALEVSYTEGLRRFTAETTMTLTVTNGRCR